MAATAAAGLSSAAAGDPQGNLGTQAQPLQGAYLMELEGPIVDAGDVVTSMLQHQAAEENESINPGSNTLVFRYSDLLQGQSTEDSG